MVAIWCYLERSNDKVLRLKFYENNSSFSGKAPVTFKCQPLKFQNWMSTV